MYQGTRWVLLKQKKRSQKSHAWAPLKIHLHWIFWFEVVWPNKPFWAPEKSPKIFSISVSNTSRDVRLFVHTHILSIHTDSVCVFSVYKRLFIRILSIRTNSVRVQRINSKILLEDFPHSAYSQFTYNLFRTFSVYKQIFSAHSQWMYRFFWRTWMANAPK
jgi:hypothetical protein